VYILHAILSGFDLSGISPEPRWETWKRISKQILLVIHGHVRFKIVYRETATMKRNARKKLMLCTNAAMLFTRRKEETQVH